MRALPGAPRPAARHWAGKFATGCGLAEGGSGQPRSPMKSGGRAARPGRAGAARDGAGIGCAEGGSGAPGWGRTDRQTDRQTWAPRGVSVPLPSSLGAPCLVGAARSRGAAACWGSRVGLRAGRGGRAPGAAVTGRNVNLDLFSRVRHLLPAVLTPGLRWLGRC